MTETTAVNVRSEVPLGRRLAIGFAGWVAIAAVLSVAGSISAASSDGGAVALEVGAPAASGAPLPMFDETAVEDAAVGLRAPALVGVGFDGVGVGVIPGDGVAKVVVFVAHWCSACQAEVADLAAWMRESGVPDAASGAELVAVSTQMDAAAPNYPPSAWLRDAGWEVPTLVDDAEFSAAEAFGVPAVPFYVVIGRDGFVLQRHVGQVGSEQVEAALSALASGVSLG